MLRPAVAATNCAKPGNASGLDILEASPIVLKTRFWPSLSGKVPPPGRAVNDGRRPALSRGIAGPACPDENFCPGLLQIPDKTSPFLRISRVSAERYDDHAGPRVSIMPRTLDTQDSGYPGLWLRRIGWPQWIPHISPSTQAPPAAFSPRSSWSRRCRCER